MYSHLSGTRRGICGFRSSSYLLRARIFIRSTKYAWIKQHYAGILRRLQVHRTLGKPRLTSREGSGSPTLASLTPGLTRRVWLARDGACNYAFRALLRELIEQMRSVSVSAVV
jgi:hypothetical protein